MLNFKNHELNEEEIALEKLINLMTKYFIENNKQPIKDSGYGYITYQDDFIKELEIKLPNWKEVKDLLIEVGKELAL